MVTRPLATWGGNQGGEMLVQCGECHADVSDKAAACPKCGAPSRYFRQRDTVVVTPQRLAERKPQAEAVRPAGVPRGELHHTSTPGYEQLDDLLKTVINKNYFSVMLGGAALGLLLSVLLSLLGMKSGSLTLFLMLAGSVAMGGLKFYAHQRMTDLNNQAGVPFVSPEDESWVKLVGIVGVALILYNTKPPNDGVLKVIDDQLIKEISQQRFEKADAFGVAILKLSCKLDVASCARTIRASMNIKLSDAMLFKVAEIGFGKKTHKCLGAVKIWHCFW